MRTIYRSQPRAALIRSIRYETSEELAERLIKRGWLGRHDYQFKRSDKGPDCRVFNNSLNEYAFTSCQTWEEFQQLMVIVADEIQKEVVAKRRRKREDLASGMRFNRLRDSGVPIRLIAGLRDLKYREALAILEDPARFRDIYLEHGFEARWGLTTAQKEHLWAEHQSPVTFPIACFRENAASKRWFIYDSERGLWNQSTAANAKTLRVSLVQQYVRDLATHQQSVTGDAYLVYTGQDITVNGELRDRVYTNYEINTSGEAVQCEPVVQTKAHLEKAGRIEDDGSKWAFDPEGYVLFNHAVDPQGYTVTLPYRCIGDGTRNQAGDTRPGHIKNKMGYGESPMLPESHRTKATYGSAGYRDAIANLFGAIKELNDD